MPVTRTPPKTAGAASTAEAEAEEAAHANSVFEWPLVVDGQTVIIRVNENQHQYLNSGLTQEDHVRYLRWIFDDQAAKAQAEAEAAAAAALGEENQEDLHANTPSPTPTVKSLDTIEQIRNRTKIQEGSLRNNPDVKGIFEENNNEWKNEDYGDNDDDDGCKDRHHQFVLRTQTHLAAPAKLFARAVNALKIQLDHKFTDEVIITIQDADALLKKVYSLYEKVEETRYFCEEALNEDERPNYGYYMQNKYADVLECERIHKKFVEHQEQSKKLRNQLYQPPQTGPPIPPPIITTTAPNNMPIIVTSTPYHQQFMPPPGPNFDSTFGQHHQQQYGYHQGQQQNTPPGAHADPTFGQHHDQRQSNTPPGFRSNPSNPPPGYNNNHHQGQQNPPPGTHTNPGFGQHYGQNGPQQNPPPGFGNVNPPPGFNIHEDQNLEVGSRIPTPSAPSVIEPRHHTRFKLQEELSLVDKWDASQPRAYMAFRAQWANFYEKMKKEERSNLDLYYALLKVLTGAAKEFVFTKYPNDQSYAQAMAKLDEHFYNPTNLLRDMVHNLLKNQPMHDNYDSLLSGITKLNDAWHDLNQADLTKGQLKGLLFIAATEKNLSEEGWRCWIEEQNHPRFRQNPMDAFEISTYLGAIKRAMLNVQKRKNAIGPNNNNNNNNKSGRSGKKKNSTLYGAYNNAVGKQKQGNNPPKVKDHQQAQGPKTTCVFCGQKPHRYQLYCPKLKQLQPKDIYAIMRKEGIECQMCLGLSHRTKNCPAMLDGYLKKCNIVEDGVECGRYHARALHEQEDGSAKEQPPPKQE